MPKLPPALDRERLHSRIHSAEVRVFLPRLAIHLPIWEFPFPGGLVLAREDLQGLFILNETAALLWEWRLDLLTEAQMASRLGAEFGIPLPQAQWDVACTLCDWERTLLSAHRSTETLRGLWAHSNGAIFDDFSVNKHHIRIRVSDAYLLDEIAPRLERLEGAESNQPDLEFRIWADKGRVSLAHAAETIACEENLNAIRAILLQEIVRRTESTRDWLAILHAGACGSDETCVLLAGRSHSGKTTLCAGLMAAGVKFYCDDSAAVGRGDGRISPMPFRLMLRDGSREVLQTRFPEIISSLVFERRGENRADKVCFLTPRPIQVASSPGLAKALVFVCFSLSEKTSLQRLLPFETLLKLQESGFWVQHDRESIVAFLDWLLSLPAFILVYSDLDEAMSKIQEIHGL